MLILPLGYGSQEWPLAKHQLTVGNDLWITNRRGGSRVWRPPAPYDGNEGIVRLENTQQSESRQLHFGRNEPDLFKLMSE